MLIQMKRLNWLTWRKGFLVGEAAVGVARAVALVVARVVGVVEVEEGAEAVEAVEVVVEGVVAH